MDADTPVDGRHARSERSREAVVDAILQLLREGNRHPGAAEIAERAGVSLRSVFRHFDDLETLWATAVERHAEIITPLFVLDLPESKKGEAHAPFAARVDALVAQRAALYEEMRPVRVVAEWQSDRSEALREGLARGRRILTTQLSYAFAPELSALDGSAKRELLAAVEMATSYAAWTQLRVEQSLSIPKSQAAFKLALRALFGQKQKKTKGT